MRILCIADDVPWPETSGYKIRLANVLRSLSAVGPVDLLVRVPHDFDGLEDVVPPDVEVARLRYVRGDPPRSTGWLLAHWPVSRLPRALLRMSSDGAREELRRWMRPPYDLTWIGHAHGYVWFGDLVDGPTIVDLDNLEDQHIRHHRRVRSIDRRRGRRDRIRSRPREAVASLFDRVDERRWRRLQQRTALEVEFVTVCSELDRVRMALDNVAVLPNAYDLPDGGGRSVDRTPKADGPVAIMVGLLTYEPNADAAWYFVDEVLPKLREAMPNAELRLVGRYDWQIEALHDRPGVLLTGRVDDLASQLLAADIAVIPIRFGGGTRIKALEAFAWRLPLVSTAVGVEGIAATPDVHYLRAETAEEFVDACARLTVDADLRARLTDAAAELWRERYRPQALSETIAGLATAVASSGPEEVTA